jgi:hypothetical protein
MAAGMPRDVTLFINTEPASLELDTKLPPKRSGPGRARPVGLCAELNEVQIPPANAAADSAGTSDVVASRGDVW